jgi:hypothetical protein
MDILKDAQEIASIIYKYNKLPSGNIVTMNISKQRFDEMIDMLNFKVNNGAVVYGNKDSIGYESLVIYGIKFNFNIV